METFTSVAHADCICIVIPIIAFYDFKACTIDIIAAFLLKDINAEAWVTWPDSCENGYPDEHAIRTEKTTYSLKQFNLLFNLKISSVRMDVRANDGYSRQ